MTFNSSEIKRLICVAQLLHREFNFGRILFSVEDLFYLFLRWKKTRDKTEAFAENVWRS